jgi:hypothetical protein
MDSLDLFFKKYAYKFHKGYPDVNDKNDIMLLEKLLRNIGINLQKEKDRDKDYDAEIMSLLKSIDDENIKKKVLNYLKKKDTTEDNKTYKELENILSKKGLSANLIELIFLYATTLYQEDKLLEYVKSPILKLIEEGGNLKNQVKEVGFDDKFINKIFTIKPTEGGKGVGFGEIPLILFFDGKKVKIGDVEIDGKLIEVKGNGGRFSTGKGKGREGNITSLYQDFQSKYDAVKPKTNLSDYILEILNEYPEAEEDINEQINKIYPDSENYKITKENVAKDLLVKYVASYVNMYPSQEYILISGNGNYKLYTGENLIGTINKGEIEFTNITPSTSYPQLKLI